MNPKQLIAWVLILVFTLVVYLAPTRGEDSEIRRSKVYVEFENGSKRTLVVEHPSYAGLTIYQNDGGYRLSTWEYCMLKGIVRCEITLVNGVIWYEYVE